MQYYFNQFSSTLSVYKKLPPNLFFLFFLLLLIIAVFGCNSPQKIILTQNGKSNYQIVVANKATEFDKKAGKVLKKYLQQISGVELPLVADEVPVKQHEIIIGNNRHLQKLEIDVNFEPLEDDGFTIRTVGEKLIIAGGKKKGTLYGVYSFLEDYLGCRKYSSKVTDIPKQTKIELLSINDTQVPVIKFRDTHYRDTNDPEYTEWHKLDHNSRGGHPDWGFWCHTFNRLVPPDKYFKTHPEYYALVKGERMPTQLCLSHPDVLKILLKNLREEIQQKPDAHYWSVSQNDNVGYCQCSDCKAIDEREGTPMGSVLEFVNKVAAEFSDKTISTLAYQYSRSAPKFLRPAANVNFMLCSIECNRSRPISTDPTSASFRKDVVDWSKITDNILIWDYVVQFSNLVSPFPNLRVLQPNIKFFVENNATAMFQQGNREIGGEFAELRAYLISKLLWNPDTNLNLIMNDFLEGYYGAAAKNIREYIDLMHDTLEKSGETLNIFGNPLDPINGYLSPELIVEYEQIFEKAEAAVMDKPEFLERVKIARLPLEYAILEQGKHFSTGERGYFKLVNGNYEVRSEMRQRLEKFIALCNKAGFTRLKEWHTTPDEYRASIERLFNLSMQKHLALHQPVTLKTDFSPKYPAGGAAALTNGIKGSREWNCNWLGFEKSDLDAVIDLGAVKPISMIKVDFIQDISSWIFLPKRVEYLVSQDGKNYKLAASIDNTVPENQEGVFIEPFNVDLPRTDARYIRVKADAVKVCPGWHIGAGGKAWIFVDEVMVF